MASTDDRPAIISDGLVHTRARLNASADGAAAALLESANDLSEARIAVAVTPGAAWLTTVLGVWRAGGLAVPLPVGHPRHEIEYVLRDAGVGLIVADDASWAGVTAAAAATGGRVRRTADLTARVGGRPLPEVAPSRRALMLYTSGTTAHPKGVVTTHANLDAQVRSLLKAWDWTSDDRTLLALPLHHVHGIVNVVLSAWAAGAVCEMLPRFDAAATWARLASGEITVFSAVPTIYHRLIAAWEAAPAFDRRLWSVGASRARLMMSGSAALPVGVLDRWRTITGHTLLERYGMTEIGMGLSNPLREERRPGFVGTPLPDVDARLVDEAGHEVPPGAAGEVEIRGPGVFLEYWGRPEATRDAFRDGWFRTGDVAVVEGGSYRLLGRRSIDILKTGGHKVSALEIEEVLRTHPAIADCAVVGLPDEEWGARIAAAVELRPGATLALEPLQAWAKMRLAPYKIPRVLCCTTLPRNAMGKIVKPDLVTMLSR